MIGELKAFTDAKPAAGWIDATPLKGLEVIRADQPSTPMHDWYESSVCLMRPSPFFDHFRRATAMTPQQYLKPLKLPEARRLLRAR